MSDPIDRQAAIAAADRADYTGLAVEDVKKVTDEVVKELKKLPPAQPERKRMSNKEWIDFLSEQFDVSRTSAREMLHGLMKWKAEDNFKKQFRR